MLFNKNKGTQTNGTEETPMNEMKRVGARIAALRKEKGLTQAELAERLCVSYQAVSNWERGESMPDIFKLPALANALGTTADALLNDREEEAPASVAAPLAQGIPQTPQRAFEPKPAKDAARAKIKFSQLEEVAPFLSQETLGQLAIEAAQREDFSLSDLEDIAPYLPREALGELAMAASRREDFSLSDLEDIAPYLPREAFGELAMAASGREGFSLSDLEDILAYLPQETIGELAMRAIERDGFSFSDLEGLLAFLPQGKLEELANKALLG